MHTVRIKQSIAIGLLGLALTACGASVGQAPPTAGPTNPHRPASGPTMVVPTVPPTPQPIRALPPLDDPAWIELWRGDNNANLVDERVLYLPATITAQTNFNDEFLATQAVALEALVISETGPDGTSILLQVDRQALAGPAAQLNFGPGPLPAAFLAALDPGSSYFLSLLPLANDGTAAGEMLAINWYGPQGGYTLAPMPGGSNDIQTEPQPG